MRLEVTPENVRNYLDKNLNSDTALVFHGLYKLPHSLFRDLMDHLINYEVLPAEFNKVSFNETDMKNFLDNVKARAGRSIPGSTTQLSQNQVYFLDTLEARKIWRWSYDTKGYLPMPVYPYLHASIPIGNNGAYASNNELVEAARQAGVCFESIPSHVPDNVVLTNLNTLQGATRTAVTNHPSGGYQLSDPVFTTGIAAIPNFIKSFFPILPTIDNEILPRLKIFFEINGEPSVLSKYPGFAYWLLGTHRPHVSIPDWVELLGRNSSDTFTSSYGNTFRDVLENEWKPGADLAKRDIYSWVEYNLYGTSPPVLPADKKLRWEYARFERSLLDEIYKYKYRLRQYIWKNYHLARTRLLGRFPTKGETPIKPNDSIPNPTLADYMNSGVIEIPIEKDENNQPSAFTV